jgi:hypothetical protein
MGKSQAEIAGLIRMSRQQLRDLEEDQYDSIPAPMYVRGFIKLYAKKVGLNHEPLIELYERMQRGEPLTDEPPVVAPTIAEPERDAPSKPVQETKDAVFEHPEISREVSKAQPSFLSILSDTLEDSGVKLKEHLSSIDFSWMNSPKLKMGGGAVFILFILLFGLKTCIGDRNADTSGGEDPVIDDPLLSPPEPVFFQLPSSFK